MVIVDNFTAKLKVKFAIKVAYSTKDSFALLPEILLVIEKAGGLVVHHSGFDKRPFRC